jgi:hypothetical protein
MEMILLAVTIGSLLVAGVMSVAAWRLTRAEHARASARVAALAAAAAHGGDATASVIAPAAVPIASVPRGDAVVGNAPAAPAESVVAARRATFPQLRAVAAVPADVEELASDTFADELPLRATLVAPVNVTSAPAAPPPVAETFLGVAAREPNTSGQRKLAIAAAIFCAVLGAGAYLALARTGSNPSNETGSLAVAGAPLELMSLRHERQGGRLTLSGLVRNPAAGATIENLTAVVFLFDAQGGFVSSARAGVDFKRLAAGDESPFVITIDAPATVARYRVSFRTEAGVIAHVDRRAEQPVATVIASGTK